MKTKTVLQTLGVTMAAGAAAMLIGSAAAQPNMKKMAKKKLNAAMKGAESLLDSVQDFFG